MVTFNYCGELVQDGVVGQVDLVEKNPVSILHALDQRSLDELEYKSTTRLKLLRSLLQVLYHSVQPLSLILVLLSQSFL